MKNLLILLFLLSYSSLFSQDNDDNVYYLTRTISLPRYNIDKATTMDDSMSIIAQKDWRFVIDHSDANGVIIRFLKWKKGNSKNITVYATMSSVKVGDSERNKTPSNDTVLIEQINYYYLSNADHENHYKVYVNENPRLSFVTGAITVPIKIRPGSDALDDEGNKLRPFDFTGDVNIGLSVGLRFRVDSKGKSFIIPSVGINLTSVSIDETTVKNDIISSKTNASSLTPFVGLIGEYDNFQIAALVGWDRLSGKMGENWLYQGKPWFGIGLGYNVFNTSNNTPAKN
ncbi:hypothetical protein [Lacinutrix undariae]